MKGDVLAEFDIDAIEATELPVTTPVVVSNSKKTGPLFLPRSSAPASSLAPAPISSPWIPSPP
ncbi:hypothetical protein QP915_04505 [Corynebacterium sp. MSK158]|nr:hypothetical protein [Corynebacterium sp. MSK158]MDK8693254.1 hypothetical protein [Corynebacterium sp. MSK158]